MGETRHSDGPLRAVREDEYRTYIETDSGRIIGTAHGAWEDTPEQHVEIAGNAQLWAAAPDYFEATEAMRKAMVNNAAPYTPEFALAELAKEDKHITLSAELVLALLQAHAKATGSSR